MKKLLFAVILACVAVSCDSDDHSPNATVIDLGIPEADGCGWMLKINSEFFKPVNLPDKFKESGLKVRVYSKPLKSVYQCGFAPAEYDEIQILSITKD